MSIFKKNKVEKNKHGIHEAALSVKRKLAGTAFKKTTFLMLMIAIFLFILCGGAYILFKPYTIRMNLNDGKGTVLTETYSIGSGKITLGTPVRSGYRFLGWTGSGLSKAKTKVTVGNGKIGNLKFKANWSNKLTVTCEDWVVDADGNLIENITSSVDKFLKSGKSSKKYKVVDRTTTVKAGSTIRGSKWGNDKNYKAYHSDYVYIGDSGKAKVKEDGLVVYRYFYPVVDVSYLVDGASVKNAGVKAANVGTFNIYINDELVAENVSDYCKGAAYGSVYRVEPTFVYAGYRYVASDTDAGIVDNKKNNVKLSFETVTGDLTVTCEDWLVDANGNLVRNVTGLIDMYLSTGKSTKNYIKIDRFIKVNAGDVVNAESWGNDTSYKAYHNSFVYVGSSGDKVIEKSGERVFRYFYPVLDIGAYVNEKNVSNTANYAKINVYVNDELVTEYGNDYCYGAPCGASYRVEIAGYTDFSYVHVPSDDDSGIMGSDKKSVYINFVQRTGDTFVNIEDWVVDVNGNRVLDITDTVDKYLSAGNSAGKYKQQNRAILVKMGETFDPSMFGNDTSRRAYVDKYVYAGASNAITIEGGGMTVYRYFYPVLNINTIVSGHKKNNSENIATYSLYLNGSLAGEGYDITEFIGGVPVGTEYEITNVKTMEGYEYVDDGTSKGVMGDTAMTVYIPFTELNAAVDVAAEGASDAESGIATDGASTGVSGAATDGVSTGNSGASTDGASTGNSGASTDGASTGNSGASTDGASTGNSGTATEGATEASSQAAAEASSQAAQ